MPICFLDNERCTVICNLETLFGLFGQGAVLCEVTYPIVEIICLVCDIAGRSSCILREPDPVISVYSATRVQYAVSVTWLVRGMRPIYELYRLHTQPVSCMRNRPALACWACRYDLRVATQRSIENP